MDRYNPSRPPDPVKWLAMEEVERIEFVQASHPRGGMIPAQARLHATIHAVVENQIAMGLAEVQDTMERLMAEKLTRHEALHAIGSIVAGEIRRAVNEPSSQQKGQEAYLQRVKALTASAWLKGKA